MFCRERICCPIVYRDNLLHRFLLLRQRPYLQRLIQARFAGRYS